MIVLDKTITFVYSLYTSIALYQATHFVLQLSRHSCVLRRSKHHCKGDTSYGTYVQ